MEGIENDLKLGLGNPDPCIFDLTPDVLDLGEKTSPDCHSPFFGKFNRIIDEVAEDLRDFPLVTEELRHLGVNIPAQGQPFSFDLVPEKFHQNVPDLIDREKVRIDGDAPRFQL